MSKKSNQSKINKNDTTSCDGCDTEFQEGRDYSGMRNALVLIVCLLSGILLAYVTNSPIGNYIPVMLIAMFEWYRSYTRQTRSYYGLFRLLLYILIISLWGVFILRLVIQGIAFLLGYRHIPLNKVQHLFPYALMFTAFARNQQDMNLHDKRRYLIHLLYDIPAFVLVMIFKLLNNPLNALYSQITTYCYMGCLPIPSDVENLNKIGIEYVVNMCAEYYGPRKTYKKYNIKQLHLPTIDSTAPSIESIEKAMQFMNEAYTNKKKVFVHCKSGMGRSATIVFCHLVANENMTPDDAIKLMKEKRPEITTTLLDFTPVKRFLYSLKNKKA